ncbi:hemolysin family protein [Aeromicrobium sp. Sec7.5]|uniref:hemolysin family protein n=1 Tax=Aeromicrobium sp. Sec7.5 TaxID=3121276 RepID=UPI002FE44630
MFDPASWTPAVIAVVLAFVAGLLTSTEAALSSFSRARAEELDDEGRAGAARLMRILDDPAPYLNSLTLVRVLAETASVVLAAIFVAGEIEGLWQQFVVATLVMGLVSFVFIGVGPRTLGRQRAEAVAVWSAWPVMALEWVLGPIPKGLIVLGNALTPGRGFTDGPFASEVEVREMVDLAAASSLIETDESKMIHSVFELGDTIVREVMVPRTDVVSVEHTKTLRKVMSLSLQSGYSRLPVVEENLDDVVGIAYLKDVTKRVFDNHTAEQVERIATIMRPCLFVPDTKPVDDLLREMQASRTHIAIVVDEFGGTAGLVTIEDILEEIVGEITDEYDSEPDEVEALTDGSWRVSVRLDIDDLAELTGIDDLEDEEVDTVGGLLAKYLGEVPLPGSHTEALGLHLLAEGTTGRRNKVGHVRVTRLTEVDESVASGS